MKEKRKPKDTFKKALADLQDARKPFWEEKDALESKECPQRVEALRLMHVNIDNAGGNCPVQIEGTAKGQPFYFRARGDYWSLGIGGEPVGNPDWEIREPYGTWPDAGWMPLHEAYDFLAYAVQKWLSERK